MHICACTPWSTTLNYIPRANVQIGMVSDIGTGIGTRYRYRIPHAHAICMVQAEPGCGYVNWEARSI